MKTRLLNLKETFYFHTKRNINSKITNFTIKIIQHELYLAETKHQNYASKNNVHQIELLCREYRKELIKIIYNYKMLNSLGEFNNSKTLNTY